MSATQAKATEATMMAEEGSDQYLTFMLDGEEYGVDILRVQEIKGWSSATPLPNMPEHILGVINLRGAVVPIVDLRKYLGLKSTPFDQTTVIIVVKIADEKHGERIMGLVVDAVSEVHNVKKTELKPAPNFGGAISTDSIKGLATLGEKMLIALDIDRLMSNGVLQALERAED